MNGAGDGGARAAMRVLAGLAVVGALYLGHPFFVPVCLGLVLTLLLVPPVGWLARHHVPVPAGAALTVLASLALLVGAGAALDAPVRDLARQVPPGIAAARARLAHWQAPLARLGLHVPAAPARSAPPASNTPPQAAPGPAPAGTVAPPNDAGRTGVLNAVERTFGVTAELLSELVEVLLLAFFLLAGARAWPDRLARAVPDPHRRDATLRVAGEVRAVVARYVFVTAGINVLQGAVVALVMWALGVPSPLLWGALTVLLEFVPYFGGFVMIALLLVAGLAGGGSLGHALLAPLAYLAITTLQNNLVSPAAYGRGLRLNPAAILLAVMFWYALWGVAGAFLAVPLLAAIRVLASHVPPLAPVGAFLEE